MKFIDCRLSYGYTVNDKQFRPCNTIGELIQNMKQAGLSGGVLYNSATDGAGVCIGNDLLAADLAANRDCGLELFGMYTLLPSFTREIPDPQALPAIMQAKGMPVLRMNPAENRFLPSPAVLADYLGMAEKRRIPVLLDTSRGLSLTDAEAIMQAFPKLAAILFFNNVWPCDRYLRPFLGLYPNLVLDTTHLIQDGTYEETYAQFGPGRMIFGSGFPTGIIATNMLTLKFSSLPEDEKAAVAGQTLLRLIKEADYR